MGLAVNYGKGQRSHKTNTNLYTSPFLTAHSDRGSARGREGLPLQPVIQDNHGLGPLADLPRGPRTRGGYTSAHAVPSACAPPLHKHPHILQAEPQHHLLPEAFADPLADATLPNPLGPLTPRPSPPRCNRHCYSSCLLCTCPAAVSPFGRSCVLFRLSLRSTECTPQWSARHRRSGRAPRWRPQLTDPMQEGSPHTPPLEKRP